MARRSLEGSFLASLLVISKASKDGHSIANPWLYIKSAGTITIAGCMGHAGMVHWREGIHCKRREMHYQHNSLSRFRKRHRKPEKYRKKKKEVWGKRSIGKKRMKESEHSIEVAYICQPPCNWPKHPWEQGSKTFMEELGRDREWING